MKKKIYKVIGVMSGTSLDGLDLAMCSFELKNNQWHYQIEFAITIDYDDDLKENLSKAHLMYGLQLVELDHFLGRFIGEKINETFDLNGVDFIASHGHTVFHRPDLGYTLQIGNGNDISAITGRSVVFDFRSLDVALHGQGAPLVPIGDQLLFAQYDCCLNLGGFANISFDGNQSKSERIAYDICPVNIVSNMMVNDIGHKFDNEGNIGKSGVVNIELLTRLNSLEYYNQPFPKSLGREWVEQNISPLFSQYHIKIEDQLRTYYEHVSEQIALAISSFNNILVTGGGAYNCFLINLIQQKINGKIVIPASEIIEYKEALIFAFLGVLRARGEINALSSVTGAVRDSCGGIIV